MLIVLCNFHLAMTHGTRYLITVNYCIVLVLFHRKWGLAGFWFERFRSHFGDFHGRHVMLKPLVLDFLICPLDMY